MVETGFTTSVGRSSGVGFVHISIYHPDAARVTSVTTGCPSH